MRNETSLENSKPLVNNSSLLTAENSSLQSRLNLKKKNLYSACPKIVIGLSLPITQTRAYLKTTFHINYQAIP